MLEGVGEKRLLSLPVEWLVKVAPEEILFFSSFSLTNRMEERDGSWDGLLILDFCMAEKRRGEEEKLPSDDGREEGSINWPLATHLAHLRPTLPKGYPLTLQLSCHQASSSAPFGPPLLIFPCFRNVYSF